MFSTWGISTKLLFSWRVARACLGGKLELGEGKQICACLSWSFIIEKDADMKS